MNDHDLTQTPQWTRITDDPATFPPLTGEVLFYDPKAEVGYMTLFVAGWAPYLMDTRHGLDMYWLPITPPTEDRMTPADLTPTYFDLCHYADVGRRLTQAAGIATETHPTADVVLRALRMPQPTPAAIIDAAIAISEAAKEVKRR